MSCTLDPQFAGIEQSAPVAVGRKGDAVVAAEGTEPRETRRISALASGKESLEGFIDPPQHVLAAREIRERQAAIGAHRLQLVRLIVVVDRLATNAPSSYSFLKRCVVQTRSLSQFAIQKFGLGFGWVDSVLVREPAGCYAGCGSGGFVLSHDETLVRENVISALLQSHYNTKKQSAIAEGLFRCHLKETAPGA